MCSSSRQKLERPEDSMSTAARYTMFLTGCFYLENMVCILLCSVLFYQTLEELTDSYRIHSTELAKTVSQYSHTQQDVHQIRYMWKPVWSFGFYHFFTHYSILLFES